MSKVFVYLAGPITGETDSGANMWRTLVSEALAERNLVGVSPLRCEPCIGPIYKPEYDDMQFGTPQVIAAKNRMDVRRCDAVLAFLPTMSVGTLQEMGWAVGMEKPVILVSAIEAVLENAVIKATIPWRFNQNDEGFRKALEVLTGIYGIYSEESCS